MTASRQWQLIRNWLRRTYNKEVHEFFKDIPADLDLDLDISTGRSATKAVCLIGANDSQSIAEIKRGIFRDLKDRAGIYSQPMHPFLALPEITVEGYPQAQLWFYERQRTARQYNRRPLSVRVGFRIYDTNFTPTNAETLARKIRDAFTKPIFHFTTGKLKLTYRDTRKGQLFILPVPTVEEGKNVLEKVFSLLDQTPDWGRLTTSDPQGDYSKTGRSYQVYGKTIKQHTNRSGTEVYFRYAIAKVPPLQQDIPLVDTSQTYLNAFFHEANPFLVKENLPRSPKADNLPLLDILKQQT